LLQKLNFSNTNLPGQTGAAIQLGDKSSIQQALSLLETNVDEAERLLAGLVAEAPTDVRLLHIHARILMRKMKFEDARDQWQKIAELRKYDIEAHVALARIHGQARRLFEALECLDIVLRENPSHAEGLKFRDRFATELLEKIEADLSIENVEQFSSVLSQLEQIVGDHALYQPLAEHVSYFAQCAARRDVRSPDLSCDEMARLFEEDIRNQDWDRYIGLLERAIVTTRSSALDDLLEAQKPVLSTLLEIHAAARPLLEFMETRAPAPVQAGFASLAGSPAEELSELLAALEKDESVLVEGEWSQSERSALELVRIDTSLIHSLSKFYLSRDLRKKALRV